MMKIAGVDLFSVFNLDNSTAQHIIQVHGADNGNIFKDFVLNENCSVEIIEQYMHGGSLLHIKKNGKSAYAKTTNITVDNEQHFQSTVSAKPDDNHLWNIEIAFPHSKSLTLVAVERALLEMKNHHTIDKIICINVEDYRRVCKLEKYVHKLHQISNIRIKTIGYHKNHIEIQTIHRDSNSDIEWILTLTILNSNSDIFVSNRGINKDLTVSLPPIPVKYCQLPFEPCRIQDIFLSQKGKSILILYLTLRAIEHKNEGKERVLVIEVSEDNSTFRLAGSIPETAILASDFVNQQSTYNLEILNQHPSSNELETFITGNYTAKELNAIFSHKSPEEQQRIYNRLDGMAKKIEILSDFMKTD